MAIALGQGFQEIDSLFTWARPTLGRVYGIASTDRILRFVVLEYLGLV